MNRESSYDEICKQAYATEDLVINKDFLDYPAIEERKKNIQGSYEDVTSIIAAVAHQMSYSKNSSKELLC